MNIELVFNDIIYNYFFDLIIDATIVINIAKKYNIIDKIIFVL
jgi:hypothetical protein